MAFYRPPTTAEILNALGKLFRAVRAWRFYPKGHPTRRSCLGLAHAAMLELLGSNTLLLASGRTGFSFPDGELLKDPTGHSTAMAYELFVRRVQKIAFSPDLFQEDLLELCKILCLSPDVIQGAGGIDTLMAERGIRSIWVNEFDLNSIRNKRQKVEQSGVTPQGIDETEPEGGVSLVIEEEAPKPADLSLELQLETLLGSLSTCSDDERYLILARQVVACADMLQSRHEPQLFFPLIEFFASHAGDAGRSKNVRECAQFAIEQILANGDLLQRVLKLVGEENALSDKALQSVLKAGGAAAITAAIELMGRSSDLKTRKILSTVLGSLGEAAVPALLNLITDPRWFITRNICAILGVIASSEALAALTACLYHSDLRVRREATRSLAKIGGHEAEAAILRILQSKDAALYPQVITSLSGMKSRKALPEFMNILLSRDMFLKSLSLKRDVLAAIALIGDQRVTPHLVALLEKHHLLAASRGRQLKAAVALCLGRLGDVRAVPVLEKLAAGGGELGSVCADALHMIEKSEGMS